MPEPRIPVWRRQSSTSKQQSRDKRIAKWLPIAVLVSLGLWFCIFRVFHISHPPVGTYIGVLAFLAGLVTLWPPDNPLAKAAWLVIFGGFLVLEITTLYQQRTEDIETAKKNRIDEDNRFANLLKTEQDSFAEVLRENQEDFEASLGKMGNILNNITGGNSYIYFEPQIVDDKPIQGDVNYIPKGSIILNAYPKFVGSYPLGNVYIFINGPRPGLPPDINYGTVFPNERLRPRPFIEAGFNASLSRVLYNLS